jgi:hypothetical protein
MALLNFSGSVVKGTPTTLTLDKSALSGLAPVAADLYWTVDANISKVVAHYSSDEGNQRKILTFDYSSATPETALLLSLRARSDYSLDMLVLVDFDGGALTLTRETLASLLPNISALDFSAADPE